MKKTAILLLALYVIGATLSSTETTKPDIETRDGTVGTKHVYMPYWITEGDWHTELQLRNNMPNTPLTVRPVLQSVSGQILPLSPITIPGNELC